MAIFFRPPDSVAADFIPFYWEGVYHLFYLRDWRDAAKHGEGTPWHHIATRDFVTFEDWGEALPRGPIGSQDAWVFTGCVFEHDGTFHIFYTGHNHHLPKVGKANEAVMHATSKDLRAWTKHPGHAFFAPTERGYERDDWRDPFVFRDPRTNEFGMLLAARKTTGPSRYRGSTAFLTSKDLVTWTPREPFWDPGQFYTHECPDLFRLGEWWYLVFSEFSDRFMTRYRMSQSLDGPWLAPANDSFDARAYYAAKTAGDAERRFSFGWLPTRANEKDDGAWQWGGDLVVHEITQRGDGTLTVKPPETVIGAFKRPAASHEALTLDARGRLTIHPLGEMPDECLIEASVTAKPGTSGAGLLLRYNAAEGTGYHVRIEPAMQRLAIDRWPRPGDQPHILERTFAPGNVSPRKPVRLRVIVSGTNVVVYADDTIALSCRMYEHRTGSLALFANDGEAVFENVAVKTR